MPKQANTLSSILESKSDRLLSLDFFRGITMFLLIAEFTHVFSYLSDPALDGTILSLAGQQFHHHPWIGLRFWDLIQPFFMFIVGVAMPISFQNRIKKGQNYSDLFKHALTRSFLLLLLGWGLYCVAAGRIVFRFQNVLAQLAITYFITYLFIRKPVKIQLLFSVLVLLITEVLYRGFPIDGFNQAFVANHNFGTWFDTLYGGEDLGGHWVSFNAFPTIAHTLWGSLCGKLLISKRKNSEKLKVLFVSAAIAIILGIVLSYFTPVIKRICTSSFVILSGGISILVLAISYWLIDIKKYNKIAPFFTVVGMNSLFIYLFAHLGGADFISSIITPFSSFLFGWTGILTTQIITSILVLGLLWYLCMWLHKKGIYIRI